jgi:hypothetical protein
MTRKDVVKALEDHFGVRAKYMGAPTFSYHINADGETFTVERDGKVMASDGTQVELDALIKNTVSEDVTLEVEVPMEGHTGITLKNLLNMIYSKQVLIKKVFELDDDIVSAEIVEALSQRSIHTVDDFKVVIKSVGEDKLSGLKFNQSTISFGFCGTTIEPDAFIHFVASLNKASKEFKHTCVKPVITDNEKYTMRAWLLRLGFIGPESKKAREVLLKNLEGNSAYRHGKVA